MNLKSLFFVWSLMVLVLFAGCEERPRGAAVTFQFVPGPGADAEALLRPHLPSGDGTVTLIPIRNTELFSIVVTGDDPQKAADRANDLADAIGKALRASDPGIKFAIWERAEAWPTP